MDHLSSMDAAFLHFETPETPMHVGSLMLFELPEGYTGDLYEDVKNLVAKRMHLATIWIAATFMACPLPGCRWPRAW